MTLHLTLARRLPLQRQLYDELRAAVLSGRLAPGARLPSTRALAADLAVSRNTVTGAFDQLLAEGYIESRVGSGAYVARSLPDDLLRASAPPAVERGAAPRLSRRGRALAATLVAPLGGSTEIRAFQTGMPALDAFPRDLWARLAARAARSAGPDWFGYGHPAGMPDLRRAIADYLRAARGVRCHWEQVVVTAGSQQALDLAARVLLDPGDTAWVEDPGYMGARGAFTAAGVRCAPVPIDPEGLDLAAAVARYPAARMAYVTPAHQYPLGVTMSLARRMALLAWARRRRAWIVEDDYDSEFRYAGRPLPALQGLDAAGRVIYTGTFSKVLFPALRLGYLVAPEGAVDAFVAARSLADRRPPGLEQRILADFLEEGHFARHVRRMRALYGERREVLVDAAARELAGLLDVPSVDAGMHAIAWLSETAAGDLTGDDRLAAQSASGRATSDRSAADRLASDRAAAAGISAPALSRYTLRARPRPALLLGYAAVPPRRIQEGVRKLAAALANPRRDRLTF